MCLPFRKLNGSHTAAPTKGNNENDPRNGRCFVLAEVTNGASFSPAFVGFAPVLRTKFLASPQLQVVVVQYTSDIDRNLPRAILEVNGLPVGLMLVVTKWGVLQERL